MSCTTPIKENNPEKKEDKEIKSIEKEETMSCLAKVGAKAPDFTTTAYFKGDFQEFKLSDNFGSWIMLCFFPADFTFV